MTTRVDQPLDYTRPPEPKRPSAMWIGVLSFGAVALGAMGLLMGLGARHGGLYAFEYRNATVLLVLSLACMVGVATRLPAHIRPPRRRIIAAVCVLFLLLALAMIAVAAWGLVTGMRL